MTSHVYNSMQRGLPSIMALFNGVFITFLLCIYIVFMTFCLCIYFFITTIICGGCLEISPLIDERFITKKLSVYHNVIMLVSLYLLYPWKTIDNIYYYHCSEILYCQINYYYY